MSPLNKKKLSEIRLELDKLDNSLIKVIKKRTNLVKKVLKLKDKEIEVLSSFLSIWHSNRSNPNLDKMLFSTPVRKLVRNQIDMSEASFNNHITIWLFFKSLQIRPNKKI